MGDSRIHPNPRPYIHTVSIPPLLSAYVDATVDSLNYCEACTAMLQETSLPTLPLGTISGRRDARRGPTWALHSSCPKEQKNRLQR